MDLADLEKIFALKVHLAPSEPKFDAEGCSQCPGLPAFGEAGELLLVSLELAVSNFNRTLAAPSHSPRSHEEKTTQVQPLSSSVLPSRSSGSSLLVVGPPGAGKRTLARQAASHCGLSSFELSIPQLFCSSSPALAFFTRVWTRLLFHAPCVIVLTNLERISTPTPHTESDSVALFALLGCLLSDVPPGVFLLGLSTTRPCVAQLLRDSFAQEIDLTLPTPPQRRLVLHQCCQRLALHADVQLDAIADRCHGYLPADLVELVRVASAHAVWRLEEEEEEDKEEEGCAEVCVCTADFFNALQTTRPSLLQGVQLDRPSVRWSDIAGLEEVKRELQELVLFLRSPFLLTALGVTPPQGILLCGAPGTGKTMLAKAVAAQANANFFTVRMQHIVRGVVGQAEQTLSEVFRLARRCKPCVLFFDEFQAVFSTENDTLRPLASQMLCEMDGAVSNTGVMVLAATNTVELIPAAFLRPGRFDRILQVPLPGPAARRDLLQNLRGKMRWTEAVDVNALVDASAGMTGAEVRHVCGEAGLCALQRDLDVAAISQQDFEEALKKVAR